MHPARKRCLLPILCALGIAPPAVALDPNVRLTQYGHTAWRVQDGVFPAVPNSIGQTRDGYIWIGTDAGLVRFDGIRFSPWTPPAGSALPSARIISLRGGRDGSLWIGTGAGLAHWKGGALTAIGGGRGRINVIQEDPDGSVWFARSRAADPSGGLCRVTGSTARCIGPKDGFPFANVVPMARGRDGSLWTGGPEAIAHWQAGSATSYPLKDLRGTAGLLGVTALAVAPDGTAWAGFGRTPRSLRRLENGRWQPVPLLPAGVEVSALLVDPAGRLWVGTTTHGIFRLGNGGIEHFGPEEGLSSADISDLVEDREGNLWAVTSKGIDRFRNLAVTNFSLSEGLTADHAAGVLAAHDGSIWVSNAGSIDCLRDGRITSYRTGANLPGHNVTSLLEDRRGRLWVGIDSGLWILEGGRFHEIAGPHDGHTGIVWTMTNGEDGEVWAQMLEPRRLARVRDTGIVEEIPAARIPPARAQVSDGHGGLWLGGREGQLLHYHNGRLDRFRPRAPAADAPNHALSLRREDDGSVWAANNNGLVRWKDGASLALSTRNGLPCPSVLASERDAAGDLWVLTACGLSRIPKAEAARWLDHPEAPLAMRHFDALDGLRPGTPIFAPIVSRSSDGRLWFVNDHTLAVLDPRRVDKLLGPPPVVQIERVAAEGQTLSGTAPVTFPSLTSDLEIDYTAAAFTSPERIRFRYLLEGHEAAWRQAGTRRQAFYSGLGPGNYRFRVVASDAAGRWLEPGAALAFTIQPAYYQTVAFRLLVAAILLTAVWLGYRLRVRQIAAGLNARFDERLAERTRLARELHDTLLQTIQGSHLVANAALTDPPDPELMRSALERLSRWLSQATREGRDAVKALRSSTTQTNDLAEALRHCVEEAELPESVEFALATTGTVREMHPILRDELYHAGAEAIRNAIRHSGATSIQVELNYGANLSLTVTDNGRGIPETVAEAGKAGHFGLATMRERAERMGGQIHFTSRPGAGTRVEITVPGSLLYVANARSRRLGALK